MLDWVFAYGSNMDLGDLRAFLQARRCPGQIERAEPASLSGYQLVWNYFSGARGGGAANVEPAPGRELPGLALRVDAAALAGIDVKEGHPKRYRRGPKRVPVRLSAGGIERAWLYIVEPGFRQDRTVTPTRAYLSLLIGAAERYGFPAWYLEELRATPTMD